MENKTPQGITENKLFHILGVARKCYELAKSKGWSEEYSRRMFMLGWCHDIGYEFELSPFHGIISADLIDKAFNKKESIIAEHGNPDLDISDEEAYILNVADILVGPDGKECTAEYRIEEIKSRYGECSQQYKNAIMLAKKLKLIE